LDIDLIKIEKMRRMVSIADQIQAVKNRKGEFNLNNFLATAFPFFRSGGWRLLGFLAHLLIMQHNMLDKVIPSEPIYL